MLIRYVFVFSFLSHLFLLDFAGFFSLYIISIVRNSVVKKVGVVLQC